MGSSRRIGSYLSREVLARLGMPADLADLPRVCTAWDATVGEPMCEHVQPIRYADGCLKLRTDSSVWASKLRHQHAALLKALRVHEAFKDLKRLHISVQPLAQAELPGARRQRVAYPSTATRALLQDTAAHIHDPELAAALKRLARDRKREP